MKFLKFTLSRSWYWIVIGLLITGLTFNEFLNTYDVGYFWASVFFFAILITVVGGDYLHYKELKK